MRNYSDPTANAALGSINREFARLEKKAKTIKKLRDEGKLTPDALAKAQAQFTGIYRHVLSNVLSKKSD